MDKDNILQKLNKYSNVAITSKVDCHFIVPEGARFINALGYRSRLFDTGVMKLDKIKLDGKSEQLIMQILMKAKKEME